MKRLAEIAARKLEIRSLLESDGPIEFDKIEAELKALEAEETELRRRLDVARGIQEGTVEARVIESTKPEIRIAADKFDTPEYRQAFMDYALTGKASKVLELRATTGVGDVGAVIPTKIMNRIIERMEVVGRIWRRVSKTSYQGGVHIPVAGAKPTATWAASNAMSPKQKKEINAAIMFGYHKLQCRVAVDLVAGAISLPIFEAKIADNVAEAMARALDLAIIDGSGTGQPLGIVNQTGIPAERIVDFTVAEFKQYASWAAAIALVPEAYRAQSVLLMNDPDWYAHIVGMVDSTGQPIARVNTGIGDVIGERLLGYQVIPTSLLPSVNTAAADEVVAVFVDLREYIVNSNMDITYRRYFDEDTDEWVSKSTMIADGKMADTNGMVFVRKQL